jgi:hypothetical protein
MYLTQPEIYVHTFVPETHRHVGCHNLELAGLERGNSLMTNTRGMLQGENNGAWVKKVCVWLSMTD